MENVEKRFEVMVNALSADIYRYALWLCRNRTMAEDLVQETFMRAWRSLDSLRDEKKAKSWLMTTLRREHARQFERYQPRFEDVELDGITDGTTDGGTSMEIRALRQAIASLPDKYREPLVLQVIGGYSGEEIAEMLDLPRATVMTHLFRARQKLRKIMEPDEGFVKERTQTQ